MTIPSMMRWRLAMFGFGAALASCGGGGDNGSNGTTAPKIPVAVASVSVAPTASTLLPGDSVRMTATALDSHGATLTGRTIAWSSSNSSTAAVSASGTVTAVAPGNATISATIEGVRGDAAVAVSLPVGKSIAVTAATTALFIHDTLTVVATVRDAGGAIIQGKAVGWTSSAPSVATVSASGKVTTLTPGATDISAQVDGVSASIHLDVQPDVVADVARAQAKTFDKTGGTLSATSAAGATITLTVPAGAIGATPLRITVTPLIAFKGLPRDAQLMSAVKLEPSGTKFQKPLTLSIQGAGVVQSGKVLVGLIASDTAGDVSLLPARVVGNVIRILVPHFSLIGTGAVFPPELADLEHPAPTDAASSGPAHLQDVLAHTNLTSVQQQNEVIDELRKWGERLERLANDALSSDALLVDVIPQYAYWKSMLAYMEEALEIPAGSLLKFDAILSLEAQTRFDLARDLDRAIGRAKSACLLLHDIHQIRTVVFWQGQAQDLKITDETFGSGLRRAAVLSGLCAAVVLTDTQFPADLQGGDVSIMKLRWGVRFSDTPAVVNMVLPFEALIVGGGSVQAPRGNTDLDGSTFFSIAPPGGTDLVVSGTACLPPADVDATDICTPFSVRQFVPGGLAFTGALGGGSFGIAYTGTLQATGGIGTYQFSLKSGTLPSGLSLNANGASLAVRGTPTSSGTFTFTVRLAAGTHTVDRVFTITVIGGILPVGAWEDDGFVWQFQCGAGCTQPRGLYFELYRASDGTTHAYGAQPPGPFDRTLGGDFDIVVTTQNGIDFFGSATLGPGYSFSPSVTTVSGTILSDGSLSLTWTQTMPGNRNFTPMRGSGVLPRR